MNTFRKLATISAATLLMMTTAAAAQPSEEAPLVRVDYSDLDPADPKDAARLYTRLRSAAKTVCAAHDSPELHRRKQRGECIAQALDNAVDRVDHVTVFALHEARTHRVRIARTNGSSDAKG